MRRLRSRSWILVGVAALLVSTGLWACSSDTSNQATAPGLQKPDGISLTVQYQRFSYGDDATPDDDYTLNQIFALYTMSF